MEAGSQIQSLHDGFVAAAARESNGVDIESEMLHYEDTGVGDLGAGFTPPTLSMSGLTFVDDDSHRIVSWEDVEVMYQVSSQKNRVSVMY